MQKKFNFFKKKEKSHQKRENVKPKINIYAATVS